MSGHVRVVVVRANGEHTYTGLPGSGRERLAVLQSIVAGDLKSVALDGTAHVYVNEDGVFHGLPVNELATRTLLAVRPGAVGTFLCGDAVFLGSTPDGDEADCPTRIWELICRLAAEVGIPFGGPCTYPQTKPWHELASDDDEDRRDARADAERDR